MKLCLVKNAPLEVYAGCLCVNVCGAHSYCLTLGMQFRFAARQVCACLEMAAEGGGG